MPRLMSVAYTEQAVRARTKTVTRRKGWQNLKPGTRLTLCRKVMGRRKGEPLERIAEVEVVSVERQPLSVLGNCRCHPWPSNSGTYSADEMVREGFPGMNPDEFVRRFFVEAQGMERTDWVTRIAWRYLDEDSAAIAEDVEFDRTEDARDRYQEEVTT